MSHLDGCEAIVWREGTHRCELWTVDGQGELRVFNGDRLTHFETLEHGHGYARAQELRAQTLRHLQQAIEDGRH
jgi:hypothetical protein